MTNSTPLSLDFAAATPVESDLFSSAPVGVNETGKRAAFDAIFKEIIGDSSSRNPSRTSIGNQASEGKENREGRQPSTRVFVAPSQGFRILQKAEVAVTHGNEKEQEKLEQPKGETNGFGAGPGMQGQFAKRERDPRSEAIEKFSETSKRSVDTNSFERREASEDTKSNRQSKKSARIDLPSSGELPELSVTVQLQQKANEQNDPKSDKNETSEQEFSNDTGTVTLGKISRREFVRLTGVSSQLQDAVEQLASYIVAHRDEESEQVSKVVKQEGIEASETVVVEPAESSVESDKPFSQEKPSADVKNSKASVFSKKTKQVSSEKSVSSKPLSSTVEPKETKTDAKAVQNVSDEDIAFKVEPKRVSSHKTVSEIPSSADSSSKVAEPKDVKLGASVVQKVSDDHIASSSEPKRKIYTQNRSRKTEPVETTISSKPKSRRVEVPAARSKVQGETSSLIHEMEKSSEVPDAEVVTISSNRKSDISAKISFETGVKETVQPTQETVVRDFPESKPTESANTAQNAKVEQKPSTFESSKTTGKENERFQVTDESVKTIGVNSGADQAKTFTNADPKKASVRSTVDLNETASVVADSHDVEKVQKVASNATENEPKAFKRVEVSTSDTKTADAVKDNLSNMYPKEVRKSEGAPEQVKRTVVSETMVDTYEVTSNVEAKEVVSKPVVSVPEMERENDSVFEKSTPRIASTNAKNVPSDAQEQWSSTKVPAGKSEQMVHESVSVDAVDSPKTFSSSEKVIKDITSHPVSSHSETKTSPAEFLESSVENISSNDVRKPANSRNVFSESVQKNSDDFKTEVKTETEKAANLGQSEKIQTKAATSVQQNDPAEFHTENVVTTKAFVSDRKEAPFADAKVSAPKYESETKETSVREVAPAVENLKKPETKQETSVDSHPVFTTSETTGREKNIAVSEPSEKVFASMEERPSIHAKPIEVPRTTQEIRSTTEFTENETVKSDSSKPAETKSANTFVPTDEHTENQGSKKTVETVSQRQDFSPETSTETVEELRSSRTNQVVSEFVSRTTAGNLDDTPEPTARMKSQADDIAVSPKTEKQPDDTTRRNAAVNTKTDKIVRNVDSRNASEQERSPVRVEKSPNTFVATKESESQEGTGLKQESSQPLPKTHSVIGQTVQATSEAPKNSEAPRVAPETIVADRVAIRVDQQNETVQNPNKIQPETDNVTRREIFTGISENRISVETQSRSAHPTQVSKPSVSVNTPYPQDYSDEKTVTFGIGTESHEIRANRGEEFQRSSQTSAERFANVAVAEPVLNVKTGKNSPNIEFDKLEKSDVDVSSYVGKSEGSVDQHARSVTPEPENFVNNEAFSKVPEVAETVSRRSDEETVALQGQESAAIRMIKNTPDQQTFISQENDTFETPANLEAKNTPQVVDENAQMRNVSRRSESIPQQNVVDHVAERSVPRVAVDSRDVTNPEASSTENSASVDPRWVQKLAGEMFARPEMLAESRSSAVPEEKMTSGSSARTEGFSRQPRFVTDSISGGNPAKNEVKLSEQIEADQNDVQPIETKAETEAKAFEPTQQKRVESDLRSNYTVEKLQPISENTQVSPIREPIAPNSFEPKFENSEYDTSYLQKFAMDSTKAERISAEKSAVEKNGSTTEKSGVTMADKTEKTEKTTRRFEESAKEILPETDDTSRVEISSDENVVRNTSETSSPDAWLDELDDELEELVRFSSSEKEAESSKISKEKQAEFFRTTTVIDRNPRVEGDEWRELKPKTRQQIIEGLSEKKSNPLGLDLERIGVDRQETEDVETIFQGRYRSESVQGMNRDVDAIETDFSNQDIASASEGKRIVFDDFGTTENIASYSSKTDGNSVKTFDSTRTRQVDSQPRFSQVPDSMDEPQRPMVDSGKSTSASPAKDDSSIWDVFDDSGINTVFGTIRLDEDEDVDGLKPNRMERTTPVTLSEAKPITVETQFGEIDPLSETLEDLDETFVRPPSRFERVGTDETSRNFSGTTHENGPRVAASPMELLSKGPLFGDRVANEDSWRKVATGVQSVPISSEEQVDELKTPKKALSDGIVLNEGRVISGLVPETIGEKENIDEPVSKRVDSAKKVPIHNESAPSQTTEQISRSADESRVPEKARKISFFDTSNASEKEAIAVSDTRKNEPVYHGEKASSKAVQNEDTVEKTIRETVPSESFSRKSVTPTGVRSIRKTIERIVSNPDPLGLRQAVQEPEVSDKQESSEAKVDVNRFDQAKAVQNRVVESAVPGISETNGTGRFFEIPEDKWAKHPDAEKEISQRSLEKNEFVERESTKEFRSNEEFRSSAVKDSETISRSERSSSFSTMVSDTAETTRKPGELGTASQSTPKIFNGVFQQKTQASPTNSSSQAWTLVDESQMKMEPVTEDSGKLKPSVSTEVPSDLSEEITRFGLEAPDNEWIIPDEEGNIVQSEISLEGKTVVSTGREATFSAAVSHSPEIKRHEIKSEKMEPAETLEAEDITEALRFEETADSEMTFGEENDDRQESDSDATPTNEKAFAVAATQAMKTSPASADIQSVSGVYKQVQTLAADAVERIRQAEQFNPSQRLTITLPDDQGAPIRMIFTPDRANQKTHSITLVVADKATSEAVKQIIPEIRTMLTELSLKTSDISIVAHGNQRVENFEARQMQAATATTEYKTEKERTRKNSGNKK